MGTNYYLHSKPCAHCGRSDERLHIGKSAYGWVFALHIMPESGVSCLNDWIARFNNPENTIRDEYDREVAPSDMIDVITRRTHAPKERTPSGYQSWEHFHRDNHSQDGPNNLLCPKIDGRHCIGHGDGTWSLHDGEFS